MCGKISGVMETAEKSRLIMQGGASPENMGHGQPQLMTLCLDYVQIK